MVGHPPSGRIWSMKNVGRNRVNVVEKVYKEDLLIYNFLVKFLELSNGTLTDGQQCSLHALKVKAETWIY